MRSKGTKTVAENRKVRHEYFVIETYEAGIELVGTEVKSIRMGSVNLKDSWCSIDNGEIFVRGMHISPYEKGNIFNRDPLRVRKLLMHKKEINKLFGTINRMDDSYFLCLFILRILRSKSNLVFVKEKSFMISVPMLQNVM